jgi:1-acyl-sn-glycerol-3-phosphate acyltransferase
MRRALLGFLYCVLFRFFFRFLLGVVYPDLKRIARLAQFIAIGNHNSHLDTPAILSCMPFVRIDKVHPIAARDYFGKTGLGSFLTRHLVNAVLINRTQQRGAPEENPVERIQELLREGRSIVFFPEGSRGHPEQLSQFRKGIGIILKRNPDIPCIPFFLCGLGRTLPKGEFLPVPIQARIAVGEEVRAEEGETAEEITDRLHRVYEAALACTGGSPPGPGRMAQ